MKEDTTTLTKNERGVVLSGIAAAILSFLPWYLQITFEGSGFDLSTSAWSGASTIGMVLLLGSAALITINALSAGTLPQMIPWHLVSVVCTVLGTFLVIIRAFTAGSSAPGAEVGPGWSGWLLFVAAITLTVYAVRSFRESDEELDWS
jgi:hypothetical protein